MNDLDMLAYGTRLLVFLEESPQSNKYRQVFLDPEEFKKVSFSIGNISKEKDENNMEEVMFRFSEKLYELPDLQEIN